MMEASTAGATTAIRGSGPAIRLPSSPCPLGCANRTDCSGRWQEAGPPLLSDGYFPVLDHHPTEQHHVGQYGTDEENPVTGPVRFDPGRHSPDNRGQAPDSTVQTQLDAGRVEPDIAK